MLPPDASTPTGSAGESRGGPRTEEALRYLADVSAELDASLDPEVTLQRVAELTVPFLADGCMVDLVDSDGELRRLGAASIDPPVEPVLREMQRHRIDPKGPHPIARALRSGRVEVVEEFTEDVYRDIAEGDEEYLEALRRWPARSAVVAPLEARGRVVGTIALASFSGERRFERAEISLIEQVARRAANAVENARLYAERSHIADVLQESLLPSHLPHIPGVEIAARLLPSGEASEVAGDFYDAFPTGGSGWGIVVGDVCGKGVEAAALTALARYTLRAAAMEDTMGENGSRARPPSEMLRFLNAALLAQERDGRFCTAVFAGLERKADSVRVTLANAGHPHPLRLRGSRAEPLGSAGTALGIVEDPQLSDQAVDLRPGDALVMFSDGLTAGGRVGDEEVAAAVASAGEASATRLAQQLEESIVETVGGGHGDDVVIFVLRVFPSGDGAPAAEAGGS